MAFNANAKPSLLLELLNKCAVWCNNCDSMLVIERIDRHDDKKKRLHRHSADSLLYLRFKLKNVWHRIYINTRIIMQLMIY